MRILICSLTFERWIIYLSMLHSKTDSRHVAHSTEITRSQLHSPDRAKLLLKSSTLFAKIEISVVVRSFLLCIKTHKAVADDPKIPVTEKETNDSFYHSHKNTNTQFHLKSLLRSGRQKQRKQSVEYL